MTTTTLGTRILQLGALGCAFTISACLVIREQRRANPEDPTPNDAGTAVQSGANDGSPENVALYSSKGIADTNMAEEDLVFILGSKSMAMPDDYMVDEDGHVVDLSDSQPMPDEFLFSSKSAAIEILEEEPGQQQDIYLRSSKWGSIEMAEEEIPELSSQTRPSNDPTLLPSSKSFVMGEPFENGIGTPSSGTEDAPQPIDPAFLFSSKSVILPPESADTTQAPPPIRVISAEDYDARNRELEELRKRVAELEAQIAALLAAQKDD